MEYLVPKSVEEAISLLSRHREKARAMAGGTDLLVKMKKGLALPDYLINIRGISELDYIKYDRIEGLKIGALTSLDSMEKSPVIRQNFNILAQAAKVAGTPAIRNKATIGGNLCNAAPSADTAPALIVLGTRIKISGQNGEKIIPIEEMFIGPGMTIIDGGQLLTEVQIPNLLPGSEAVYIKQSRIKGADLAMVGIAVLVVLQGDILKDIKIALGAVAPIPVRAKQAEEILRDKRLNDKLIEDSAQVALSECKPIGDCRSSAAYRNKMIALLTKRAIIQAIGRTQTKE